MVGSIRVYDADNYEWITLPRMYYVISPEDVEIQTVMASGKIHTDVIGVRTKISGTMDYADQTTFYKLVKLIRKGEFLLTEFIDEDGVKKQDYFKWQQLQAEVFKFKTVSGGLVPVWVNTPINLTAREVV